MTNISLTGPFEEWRRRIVLTRPLRNQRSLVIVALLLAAIITVGIFANSGFASQKNISGILEQASALGFVSLGQTFAILVGGIDLSVGSVISASTVLMTALAESYPDYVYVFAVVTLLFGASLGVLNGALIVALRVHPLIVTLGTASIINGCVLLYAMFPKGSVPSEFEEFAYGRLGPLPVASLVMLACFALVWGGLAYTRTGRDVYAVGGNLEGARLIGISTTFVRLFAYGACGFFAALCGVYLVSRTGVGDPRVGDPLTLASITPVVVGGTLLVGGRGGVIGTLLGVYLISCFNNVLNFAGISNFYQWVIQGLIIVSAVILYSDERGEGW
jgi:ribose transport system permease protein